jgi:prepilin-type N-terminal cleavage/methylation domain-containing protein
MITLLKNNNKGLTLIEILVAFVIGSVMMIAVYSSYTIFAKSYLAIIEKMNVNKSLRNSMSAILRDIRAAGFIDINTSFAKTISNVITFADGGASNSDVINIIYDLDRTQRIQVTYKLNKNVDNLTNNLSKTIKVCTDSNCTGAAGPTSIPETIVANFVEDLQFLFYNQSGYPLTSISDPSQIKYIEVNLIIRSANEILSVKSPKIFTSGNRSNSTYDDLYYRDILSTSVWPRNIIK